MPNQRTMAGEAIVELTAKQIRDRDYYLANRERIRAQQKAYAKEHRAQITAKQYEWVAERREQINTYNRAWRKALRAEVLNAYGNRCDCCKEKEEAFLEVDHINGGGNEHRRRLGGNAKFYMWLRRNNFPDEFRLLCSNCNKARYKLGFCPHELERVAYA